MGISHLTELNPAIFFGTISVLDRRISSCIQNHPHNFTDAKMSYVVQMKTQARYAQNVS